MPFRVAFHCFPRDNPQSLPQSNDLSDRQRELEDLRTAVYSAMVDRIDQGIGRLMDAIDSQVLSENTLVLFTSDNGTDSFSVTDQEISA